MSPALAALLGAFGIRRADFCFCSHDRDVHEHHTDRTHCGSCRCPRFSAPLTWRFK